MHIDSAELFVQIMERGNTEDNALAKDGTADESVWLDVIERFPHMKKWVFHNRNLPISILEKLSFDPDVGIRMSVAIKAKISRRSSRDFQWIKVQMCVEHWRTIPKSRDTC